MSGVSPISGWEYKDRSPIRLEVAIGLIRKRKCDEFALAERLVYSKSGMPNYKRYLDEMPGVPLQDLWGDIKPIGSRAAERLGYPTQKPVALLERIIQASSNEGDTVLDPFCGCGTTVAAAQKLDRRWIGIDITQLAISLIRYRLGIPSARTADLKSSANRPASRMPPRWRNRTPISSSGGLSVWSKPDQPMRRREPTEASTAGATFMTRRAARQSRSSSR